MMNSITDATVIRDDRVVCGPRCTSALNACSQGVLLARIIAQKEAFVCCAQDPCPTPAELILQLSRPPTSIANKKHEVILVGFTCLRTSPSLSEFHHEHTFDNLAALVNQLLQGVQTEMAVLGSRRHLEPFAIPPKPNLPCVIWSGQAGPLQKFILWPIRTLQIHIGGSQACGPVQHQGQRTCLVVSDDQHHDFAEVLPPD
mmetsp:Transcript_168321/g.540779  ORF Transcript_168321/g.540779 Transcript_168321/m.540779 type:complete len:201 (+) Transcript_168321:999-1601(+)